MKFLLIIFSTAFAISLFMHEFDACHEGEWGMFKFLKGFSERTQYLLFLYVHVIICVVIFYYLWCSYQFINYPIWAMMNIVGVIHFFAHLAATRWKSNVFKSFSSFLFIGGAAVFGIINLILYQNINL